MVKQRQNETNSSKLNMRPGYLENFSFLIDFMLMNNVSGALEEGNLCK